MAAVTLKGGETFDSADVYKQVVSYLPAYARPRFLRIQVKRVLNAVNLDIKTFCHVNLRINANSDLKLRGAVCKVTQHKLIKVKKGLGIVLSSRDASATLVTYLQQQTY